ncbi:transcriptional regulator [Streptomyces sp. NPDC001661]
MSAMHSGTLACTDAGGQHRLTGQLSDMISNAATMRVSLTDPHQAWHYPNATVKHEAGKTMNVGRVTVRVAARSIPWVWLETGWAQPHPFGLADTPRMRSNLAAAARGR